jgi:outer membrane biogenesis lipoprotein LolB
MSSSCFVCVFALAGCATSLKIDRPAPLPLNSVLPKAAENFSVNGRFAAKRGEEQGNGQFRYTQQGATRTLDIFSPTATQLARIEANASSAKVSLSDGSARDAVTLSELLRQFIDIPISDAEFSSWLQGVPRGANAGAATNFRIDGKIESFRESGWTIVVSDRFDGDTGFVRRMRWTFDADNDAAKNAEVRWVFDEFSTP